MLAPLLHPASLKALFTFAAPWLSGGAALGVFAARQSEENTRQREQLARQQAEIKRLAAANADLAARLASQAKRVSAATPQRDSGNASRKKSSGKKQGFLKHILEANLKLREKRKDSTGEQ